MWWDVSRRRSARPVKCRRFGRRAEAAPSPACSWLRRARSERPLRVLMSCGSRRLLEVTPTGCRPECVHGVGSDF